MSEFLKEWDDLIAFARRNRRPAFMCKSPTSNVFLSTSRTLTGEWTPIDATARTMHPAFMQPKVAKHDPERDQ